MHTTYFHVYMWVFLYVCVNTIEHTCQGKFEEATGSLELKLRWS